MRAWPLSCTNESSVIVVLLDDYQDTFLTCLVNRIRPASLQFNACPAVQPWDIDQSQGQSEFDQSINSAFIEDQSQGWANEPHQSAGGNYAQQQVLL